MAGNQEVDLDRPGFFHFDPDLVQGNLPPDKIEYWYKISEHRLERCPGTDIPERGAMKNLLGVLTYVRYGRERAIEYFESLLEMSEEAIVNTLANLIYLRKDDDHRVGDLERRLENTMKDESEQGQLDFARGMCERGYFCRFYVIGEPHNMELEKVGVRLLHTGIEKGSIMGMNTREVKIWKFYLFKAKTEVFEHQPTFILTEFEDLMHIFLESHEGLDIKYKSRWLMEVALLFTNKKRMIGTLPTFCQNHEVLKKAWFNVGTICEEAISLDTGSSRLRLKAAKIFCKHEDYDRAEENINISLELGSNLNIPGMNRKMIILKKKAIKEARRSRELFKEAYTYGRTIERSCGYATATTFVELMDICFNLAVDTRRLSYRSIPEHDEYLDEAIRYGNLATERNSYSQDTRAVSGLARCNAIRR